MARDLLLKEHHGDTQSAVAALLKWYGSGTDAWTRRLGRALVAGVIDQFAKSEVVAAVESPLATDAALEGAARYVAHWAFGRTLGAACDWVPGPLQARLRAAATLTGAKENVAALDAALGGAAS